MRGERWAKAILTAAIVSAVSLLVMPQSVLAAGATKIHFISLDDYTEAILLESDGHYGMVDSGEDWDEPDGVTYPLRWGVAGFRGYEQQVIHYLKSQGVEKLDFYVATHAHSDHIGSGDEILNHFPTERLYIGEYDDSYLLAGHREDPSDPYYSPDAADYTLWDNQYAYDHIIEAATQNGTEIIKDLDLEENASERTFTMGDMRIEIMNYERIRDESGAFVPVLNDNSNCLVVKVTAFDKTALLTADLDPEDGDTAKVAMQMIAQAGLDPDSEEYVNATVEIAEQFENGSIVDESEKNTGDTISIDLMKMCHHSFDYNNTAFFLSSLKPQTVVVTAPRSQFSLSQRKNLPKADVFSTNTNSAAVVSRFRESGVETNYVRIQPEWYDIDGKSYYFDEFGRTLPEGIMTVEGRVCEFSEEGYVVQDFGEWQSSGQKWWFRHPDGSYCRSGWEKIDGKWYYFDAQGWMVTGWQQVGNIWYYLAGNGEMATGWVYVDNAWYYLDESGAMCTGWRKVDENWYYLDTDGAMKTDWQKIADTWYYIRTSGEMATGWENVNGIWYYLDESGAMRTGWQKEEDIWYYLDSDGAMKTGWQKIADTWYYLRGSGEMAVGWENVDGIWYYLNADGAMCTGWLEVDGVWYYLDQNGKMQRNVWAGNYWLSEDGSMAVSSSVDQGRYYVDESGCWIPGR